MSQTQPPAGVTFSDDEKKDPTERGKEPAEIAKMEADIDQTRNAITGDLRTLGERLSPEHLGEEAKKVMTEAKHVAVDTLHEAKDVATNALRQAKDDALGSVSDKFDEIREDVRAVEREAVGFVRDNAVPLALIGLGVAWFVSSRRNRDRRWEGEYAPRGNGRWRYPDGAGSHPIDDARSGMARAAQNTQRYGARAKERARGWVHEAEHEASGVAARARDLAEHEVHQARDLAREAADRSARAAYQARDAATRNARRAWEWSRENAHSHPLAVAAAALAAGVCVGLVVPETRRESELLGPERQRLFEGAREAFDDAKDAARGVSHVAKDTAREVERSLKNSASGASR